MPTFFKEFNGPLCGNGVVEEGEECDCGFGEECNEDSCYSASEEDKSKRCKLKPNAICSPSQGVCCSSSCQFKNSSKICRIENDCLYTVSCTGESSDCPINSNNSFKPNYTVCNSGTQICISGVIFIFFD